LTVLDPAALLAVWPWGSVIVAQTTTTTTMPGPVTNLRGPGTVVLLIAVALAIAASWVIPAWLDARRSYRLRQQAVDLIGGSLLDAAKTGRGLSVTELRALTEVREVATSRRETARVAMAFTLITIIGVALAALLLSKSDNASELIKTVITSLLTLLGTIVGFYFGTRADESESDSTASTPSPHGPGQGGAPVGWVPPGPGWVPGVGPSRPGMGPRVGPSKPGAGGSSPNCQKRAGGCRRTSRSGGRTRASGGGRALTRGRA
jgi:hypothetical protein